MVGYLMIFVIYKGMGLLVNICVIKLGKFYLFVCLNYCIFVKGFKLFVDKFNDFFERWVIVIDLFVMFKILIFVVLVYNCIFFYLFC